MKEEESFSRVQVIVDELCSMNSAFLLHLYN